MVAAALGRRIGLDAVVIDEVKLAVGEACSRAVHVHQKAGADDPIVVQFRDDDDILEVAVMDCGPSGVRLPAAELAGSAPDHAYDAQDPDLDASIELAAPGLGLGLAMIAGLVDDVSVEDRSRRSGTVVTMRWPIVSF